MNAIFDKIKNRANISETIQSSMVTEEQPLKIVPSEGPVPIVIAKKKEGIKSTAFEELIDNEIRLMLNFCNSNSIKLTTNSAALINTPKLANKIILHEILRKNIIPATVEGIVYLNDYQHADSEKVSLLRLPSVRFVMIMFILSVLLVTLGYCVNELEVVTGQYSWELTDTAITIVNYVYGVACAALGTVIYFSGKLFKQIFDVSLTKSRHSFYLSGCFLGILLGCFFSSIKIMEPYLTDNLMINNLIIAVISGFVADIIYSIFKQ